MLYVIRYVKCYVRNVEHENMSLIVPMMILQAKTTSRSEKSEEDTEEKRQSKGTERGAKETLPVRQIFK